ncbi:MAG: response regulator [Deferrisomatales bacterium]|nr:response regulator [Deferrisomatales bacterium]
MLCCDGRRKGPIHARQAAQGIEGFFDPYVGFLQCLGSLDLVVHMGTEGSALRAAILGRFADVTAITRVDATGRILVMDDDGMILEVAEAMLGAVGYAAQTAAEGAEAVELYRRERDAGTPFDAVILDLTVPGGMDGEETFRHLRELDPEVVALVSSGYAADSILAEFADRWFAGVLAKPHTVKALGSVLAEVLGGRGAPVG